MEKISRQEAQMQGLSRYFTGEPCKAGHIAERMVSNSMCVECKRTKEIGRYARDPDKGLARKKTWRESSPEAKESEARAKLKYAQTHRVQVRAMHKAWRNKNKDKIKGYQEAFKASHPDYQTQNQRKWRHENPAKVRLDKYRRRSKDNGVFTEADIERLFVEQDGKCANQHCRVEFTAFKRFEIDHIVPLSRDGTNWPDNLQLLCKVCNCSKGDKLMSEWIV